MVYSICPVSMQDLRCCTCCDMLPSVSGGVFVSFVVLVWCVEYPVVCQTMCDAIVLFSLCDRFMCVGTGPGGAINWAYCVG